MPGHPKFAISLTTVILGFMLARVSGMGIALLFYASPMWGFLVSVFGATNRFPSSILRRDIRRLGVVATTAIAITFGTSVFIHATRTDGEYIVKWDGTTAMMFKLRQLEKKEPASLPDYRYIIDHGPNNLSCRAAHRIAEIGDKSDLERLRRAAVPENATGCAGIGVEFEASITRLEARLREEDPEKRPLIRRVE